MLSSQEWHTRFTQQAKWTYQVRRHLTSNLGLPAHAHILDVGCGTGALYPDFQSLFPESNFYGIDINSEFLSISAEHTQFNLTQADGYALPFPSCTFDMVYCHYLLLWIQSPVQILKEMVRVTRSSCAVIALAEPDYAGRIDYPPEITDIGQLQRKALQYQGADPDIGRQLGSLFYNSGLRKIMTGVLGNEWSQTAQINSDNTEWEVLEHDLGKMISKVELNNYKEIDLNSRIKGERVLFVPTFYAIGFKQ